MNFASRLRRELAVRAQHYAMENSIPHCVGNSDSPILCFSPDEDGARHGNFMTKSYVAILSNSEWRRRLEKVHTLGKRSFPRTERGRWRELDACTSSDALLMNIFCHPRLATDGRVFRMLGVEPTRSMSFGFKARVPLLSQKFDRTEIDLRLGNVLLEAKLTESNFQRSDKKALFQYRDFLEIFDACQLPQTRDHFLSYQIIRNVLAAYALQCSLCVVVDARRPDLIDAWFEVVRCVKLLKLRTDLKIATWQEIAEISPPTLQRFLKSKYGIN
jgi:hypothetical protein